MPRAGAEEPHFRLTQRVQTRRRQQPARRRLVVLLPQWAHGVEGLAMGASLLDAARPPEERNGRAARDGLVRASSPVRRETA